MSNENRYSAGIGSREHLNDMGNMFNFIFTPGSMINYTKEETQKKKSDNLEKYLTYGGSVVGETVRLGIYYITAIGFSPVVPILLILAGMGGKILGRKNKSLEAKIIQ